MKKLNLVFLTLTLSISLNLAAQKGDMVLNFLAVDANSGNPVALENVFIQNLTKLCDTTVFGEAPYLLLSWPSGIIEFNHVNDILKIERNYPNPFIGSTKFDLELKTKQEIRVFVSDIFGSVVCEFETSLSHGVHSFEVIAESNNFYILTVSNGEISKTMKLISNGYGSTGRTEIRFLGTNIQPNFKDIDLNGNFVFQPGDQLAMKATAAGYHENTIFDNPVENTSYTFDLQPETIISLPTVFTLTISEITQNSALCEGTVTNDGNGIINAKGMCWSTTQEPDINGFHSDEGGGTGEFLSALTGLTENTIYFVRAYATNEIGTSYGNQLMFSTLSIPTVITNPVIDITQHSATSGGYVISDGGSIVTSRGVCWSTTPEPDTNDFHTVDGNGTGNFTSNLTELAENTTYYLKAYAASEIGIGYGEQVTFSTLSIPTVTTNPVFDITQNSATSGGNVLNDGGSPVTSKGICWSATPEPDINDFHTVDGSGLGNFTSYLTGLSENTIYYVRAFATNEVGTSYGDQLSFITLTVPTVLTEPVSEIMHNTSTCGGNVLNDGGAFVTAKGVCWSKTQNPTTEDDHTLDGTGTGIFTSYITGLNSNTTYFVRAYAINSVGVSYGGQIEFTTLEVANVSGYVYYAGTMIPIAAVTVEISTFSTTTMSDGHYELIGVPVGERIITATKSNYDPFSQIINVIPGGTAFNIEMTTEIYTHTVSGLISDQFGDPVPDAEIVVLNPNGTQSNLVSTSNSAGYYEVISVPQGQRTLRFIKLGYSQESFSFFLGNSNYQLDVELIKFGLPCPGLETVEYEGQVYNTVLIGDQCWLKENLNVGSMIGGGSNQTDNGIIEKYCFNNDPVNCSVYGALYQWGEAMQYTNVQGTRGICPTGWHVPTDNEWSALTNYIKNQPEFVCNNNNSWVSKSVASTSDWLTSMVMCAIGNNQAANDATGFSGKSGGYYAGGPFYHLNSRGHWWTSKEHGTWIDDAYYRGISYNDGLIDYNVWDKGDGCSVRCLKN